MSVGMLWGLFTALVLVLFVAGAAWLYTRPRDAFDAAARLPLRDDRSPFAKEDRP
ncbi:MAG: cbb3-type cytochrome c oxidase subunit 3 [Pseudomonadota bacterium]|jgi:cbb3-type cytochrome oxidase subunit 3